MPRHLRPDATLDREGAVYTLFIHLNGQIFETCCSPTHARHGNPLSGHSPGLSKKRSRSGKFSNAITPPPCVCLDKSIMRFYASHACFVDLQRCLCTQRHTSRLPCLPSSSPPPFPSKRIVRRTLSVTFSDPSLLSCVAHSTFFSSLSFFKKTSTTLIQSVTEIRARCYLRKCESWFSLHSTKYRGSHASKPDSKNIFLIYRERK